MDLNPPSPDNGGMIGRGKVSGVAAATLVAVLAAACSPGSGSGTSPSSAPSDPSPTVVATDPSPSPTQAPSPASLTVEEYSAVVAKAMKPLEAALDKLADAKRYKGLESKVNAVGYQAGKAATPLSRVYPPAELVGPNAKLIAALEAFDRKLSSVSTDVDDQTQCTGAVVRAGLGDSKATAALRKAVAAVYDRLPGEERALKLPTADEKVGDRPSTGKYLVDINRNARATFKIENSGSSDVVVTLTKGKNPDISVFVRKGRDFTVRGVPDGTYAIFYRSGGTWDNAAEGFGRNCSYSRFSNPLKFQTNRSGNRITWQDWTITLDPVLGGNAPTEQVDPDDFPGS